jgi:hypothetical protein
MPGPQGLDQGYSAHSMRATFIYASYQTHSLNHPTGIAITPPGGGSGNIYTGLYVVDSANNVIRLIQDWSQLEPYFGNSGRKWNGRLCRCPLDKTWPRFRGEALYRPRVHCWWPMPLGDEAIPTC